MIVTLMRKMMRVSSKNFIVDSGAYIDQANVHCANKILNAEMNYHQRQGTIEATIPSGKTVSLNNLTETYLIQI